MIIPSELKPLYASVKRLKMGDYLHSKDFEIYTIENDIDLTWIKCKKIVSDKYSVIIPGYHNPEDDEEAFMYLLTLLESQEGEEFMDEVLSETFINLAEWNRFKLDFTSVYKNFQELNFTDKTIKDFRTRIESIVENKPTKEEAKALGQANKKSEIKLEVASSTTMKKVFVSHASADKKIVAELVELLELIGVPSESIFFSSSPEYGIAPGEDFLARIKSEISAQTLVLFAMSRQFLESPICLCEMGAAWVLSQQHIPVLIPPFSFGDIKGVIPLTQGSTINEPQQINAFAISVAKAFNIPSPLHNPTWERKRDRILTIIDDLITREKAQVSAQEKKVGDKGKSSTEGLIGGIQF